MMRSNLQYPTSRIFVFALILLLSLFITPIKASGQDLSEFTATPTTIVVNSSTQVTFTCRINRQNLTAGTPNLQRFNGSAWTVVGSMTDNGTNGDASANDGIFTFRSNLINNQLGTVTFRASAGYRGSALRRFSGTLNIEAVQSLGVTIDLGATSVVIPQGETRNIASTVNLSNFTGSSRTVRNVTTVLPANNGLTVNSDFPSGGYTSSSSQSFVLNQTLIGSVAGQYTVTNTASIVGTAITVSVSILVTVLPPGGDPVIFPVGTEPSAVQLNTPTPIRFIARIANFVTAPATLSLRRVDAQSNPVVALLYDDGTNGDTVANDNVYTGNATVNVTSEDGAVFLASGVFPGVTQERFSAPFTLTVTCFNTTFAPSDFTKTVFDPETGFEFLSNEVLVNFVEGLSCAQKAQIAASIGGTIEGTEPALGIHQIVFPGNGSPAGVYSAIQTLLANPSVVSATPNYVGGIDEVTPNDTSYASQTQPQKIRADEAWVIARGGALIAVLDTGVDYNHPDLSSKVIKGKNYIANNNDPMDDNGHGTRCAGIAAASSNNSQGIAGIAWNSKILAVKVATAGGGVSFTNLIAGIRYAADQGASVISCSISFPAGTADLEAAVNYAISKGSLFVATSGNIGTNAMRYPGSYVNAICVGSTNASDGRSSFSNFGPQVDIAAPGENILSTAMGGGTNSGSGTSFSAPCISGCLAVLMSRFPTYTPAQIRARLERTSVPILGAGLGAGRVDLFEAVFNGSFEDGIEGWETTGTAGSIANLGPIVPRDRNNMGFASTGPSGTVATTSLMQKFTIQSNVTNFVVEFDYNFVSEEYPEWINSGYNDDVEFILIKPGGGQEVLERADVDSSSWSLVGGIDFPGGDTTTGQTGWRRVRKTIPITAGPGEYRIIVRDRGDGIYDSNVLVDRIRFKLTP